MFFTEQQNASSMYDYSINVSGLQMPVCTSLLERTIVSQSLGEKPTVIGSTSPPCASSKLPYDDVIISADCMSACTQLCMNE